MRPGPILGLSAFYHDSAACLIDDGNIIAAAQEERFSREKGDRAFPRLSIEFCLKKAGLTPRDLAAIALYEKPILSFSRLLQSFLEYPLKSFSAYRAAIPQFTGEKLKFRSLVEKHLPGFSGEVLYCHHHEAHAASAFFCSPFQDAAIVVADGVGEWACTSIAEGRGNQLRVLKEATFPHSLGLFYSAVTQYLGFKVNSDEYKVMGLAPYGKPSLVEKILGEIVDLKKDGSIALNLKYFEFPYGKQMISPHFEAYLGAPRRSFGAEFTRLQLDLAASLQWITTEAALRVARHAKEVTGQTKLCLAGGVALNGVANGAILRSGIFDEIYVQPAAGDAGASIGAALQIWHQYYGNERKNPRDLMAGAYLGPEISKGSTRQFLGQLGVGYLDLSEEDLPQAVARWLADGHVVGFSYGRMEFGPRALGHRSILGDPRNPDNQARINLKVKYRESFRPFAPAVLEEKAEEYFGSAISSPYMMMVLPLREEKRLSQAELDASEGLGKLSIVRSDVPSVTHVDYSVRLQTVNSKRNPMLHKIIKEFDRLTGCPMVINTSLNVRGEPIVCDHEDAYRCFLMTDLDIMVLDTCVVAKPGLALKWEGERNA